MYRENEELLILLFVNRSIVTEPLDVGEGKFNLVDLVSQAQRAPVSAGVAQIWPGARRLRVRRLRRLRHDRG
jgi:hypothetical protein